MMEVIHKPTDKNLMFFNVEKVTVIGVDVPIPTTSRTVRIGSGETFLEIRLDEGTAEIVGATSDEAVSAVLSGVMIALQQNPAYARPSA